MMVDIVLLLLAVSASAGAARGWYMGHNGGPAPLVWLAISALLFALVAVLRGVRLRKQRLRCQQLEDELSEQRQQAERQLEELQRADHSELLTFCNSLSHTLRMPLSIVRGYAELLVGGAVSEPQAEREYLKKILQHTQYISETVTVHLQNARSENPRETTRTRVDIVDLAQQMANDMRPTAANQGITINVVSATEKLFMLADVYQLTRMFLNVLENAIKYMNREGMVAITVAEQDGMARITIQDDGVGLEASELPHLFEDQYRGSNSVQGSGHGLHIVKTVVEQHGGQVEAKSSVGQGMGIVVTLPLA